MASSSASVQVLWFGKPLSRLEVLCLRSFAALGHRVQLFSYDLAPSQVPPGVELLDARTVLPETSIFTYGPAAGEASGSLGAFANLFRLKLLLERGGWWVDADMVGLRALPECEALIPQQRMPDGKLATANCAMHLPAGSELARYCLEEALHSDPAQLRYGQTGPILVQRAIGVLGLQEYLVPPNQFCPIDWFSPQHLVSPGVGVPEEAFAVHFWNEIWRRKGWDKNASPPPGSLYDRLLKHHGVP